MSLLHPIRLPPFDIHPSITSANSTPQANAIRPSSSSSATSDPPPPERNDRRRKCILHGGLYHLGQMDDRDWKSRPKVKVKLTGFLGKPSTWDVYRFLASYGNITSIGIEDRHELEAYITFCPPPNQAIWRRNFKHMSQDSGAQVPIKVQLLPRARDRMVYSPVNRGVSYPECMILPLVRVEFGFMQTESVMRVMQTVQPPPNAGFQFQLDLQRREVHIKFPLRIPSSPGQGQYEVAMFCFTVSLPKISIIHVEQLRVGQKAIILPLERPPEFFRQTKDIQATHDARNNRWYDWVTWLRQTDIVNNGVDFETTPVKLSKEDAIVDIGRWTTYRLILDESKHKPVLFQHICQALKDYNVRLVKNKIALLPREDIAVWRLLDGSGDTGLKRFPFQVRYQLEVCLSHGFLHESNITKKFLQTLADLDELMAIGILEQVADTKRRFFNPMEIFNLKAFRSSVAKQIPAHCTLTRSATITPSMIYYFTPAVEISNRVIRHWGDLSDRFLRVRFTDELDNGRVRSQDNKTMDEVFNRITRTMENGIFLGDRKYEFLAFGNSQFRENGAYFFCPTPEWSTQILRSYLGKMDEKDEKIPAKCCARIGQNFSTTRGISAKVFVKDVCRDVERNGYNFTDGVGKISALLARLIAEEFGLSTEDPPSVFQFRLGGCKGVLAVAPDIAGHEVHIRPSQAKFAAIHEGLEIIRASSYVTAVLNRQIIIVLSTLGVSDATFRTKLKNQLEGLTRAMEDEVVALSELEKSIDFNQITLTLASMVMDGFMGAKDPFMMSMLRLWRSWSVKYLKEKAKIPIGQGACLLGCVDETGELKGHFESVQLPEDASTEEKIDALPEIFCYVDRKKKGTYEPIEGLCILARNPSLHPGDIRVVHAVDNTNLHHLRNVVVIPQTGDRDLGNMCSGGDLDGDDYLVIWDQDLIPNEWNHPAMDFTAVQPHRVKDVVTVKDMTQFFVNYMKNDRLPTIAHAHLAMADSSQFGVKSEECIALARLHSQAVDYPKSGVPAVLTRDLRPRSWPHFMEKQYAKSTYRSQRILGQMYDMVKLVDFEPDYNTPFDERVLGAYEVSETMLQQALEIKEQYDIEIRRIMSQHGIETEFEVWSTFVMKHNGEKKDYSFAEELGHLVSAFKDRHRKTCIEKAGGEDLDKLLPFVTAMYKATSREIQNAVEECQKAKIVGGKEIPLRIMDARHMPLISFPWLFDRELGKVARDKFHTRESVTRHQGAQKHVTRRAPVSLLDADDTIEIAEGVVHRGEIIDFFNDDSGNSLPAPIKWNGKKQSEHAHMIDAAIEVRLQESEPAKQPRPIKQVPNDNETIMVQNMVNLEPLRKQFPKETKDTAGLKSLQWHWNYKEKLSQDVVELRSVRDGYPEETKFMSDLMVLQWYRDGAETNMTMPYEDFWEGLLRHEDGDALSSDESEEQDGETGMKNGVNNGVVEVALDLGKQKPSAMDKLAALMGNDFVEDDSDE